MNYLTFIIILSLLSTINNLKTNKFSLSEKYEVEDLALRIIEEKGDLLKILFDFDSVSGGINCELYSFVVESLKNYLLQKNGFEKFYALF